MSLLEVENTGEGRLQGVVLALVGPEPDCQSVRDSESPRSLRMYSLASLTSLARWAASQKVRSCALRSFMVIDVCLRRVHVP